MHSRKFANIERSQRLKKRKHDSETEVRPARDIGLRSTSSFTFRERKQRIARIIQESWQEDVRRPEKGPNEDPWEAERKRIHTNNSFYKTILSIRSTINARRKRPTFFTIINIRIRTQDSDNSFLDSRNRAFFEGVRLKVSRDE
ncbi:hypothetical protein G5I_12937 [Acromyrmex echinatior]|uniref:Uncharacterized protein n=1 Tax=Acromyrmex echinatior TaxID=103372 RepID=F4X3M9_ACREC|nr:hypothetical protein G5I_12937 [Acromyrmex echinatior]